MGKRIITGGAVTLILWDLASFAYVWWQKETDSGAKVYCIITVGLAFLVNYIVSTALTSSAKRLDDPLYQNLKGFAKFKTMQKELVSSVPEMHEVLEQYRMYNIVWAVTIGVMLFVLWALGL